MNRRVTFTVKITFTGPVDNLYYVQESIRDALANWVNEVGLVADEEDEATQHIEINCPGLPAIGIGFPPYTEEN